jgi:hypothetical protein
MSLKLSSVLDLKQSIERFVIFSEFMSRCKLSSLGYLRRAKEQHTKTFVCSKLLGKRATAFPLLLLGIDRLKKASLTLFC